jgi:hypothetical protein
MLLIVCAVLGIVSGSAHARNLRTTRTACRSACADRLEACRSGQQRHRKCRRRIMHRCRLEGVSSCLGTTTTTVSPTATSSTSTTTAETSSTLETSSTTTETSSTTTTSFEDSALPAPDVRGVWNAAFDSFADSGISIWIDGCGFVDASDIPTVVLPIESQGQLIISGDSYSPFAKDPGLTAVLGPLSHWTAGLSVFQHSDNRYGNENFVYNARGAVELSGDSVCDENTGCCITPYLEIPYGCDNPYCPPEPDPPVYDGGPARLTLDRRCDDPQLTCSTSLAGGISRSLE